MQPNYVTVEALQKLFADTVNCLSERINDRDSVTSADISNAIKLLDNHGIAIPDGTEDELRKLEAELPDFEFEYDETLY